MKIIKEVGHPDQMILSSDEDAVLMARIIKAYGIQLADTDGNSITVGPNSVQSSRIDRAKAKYERTMAMRDFLTPKAIIHSGPKTIVLWNDKTKTIVSCAKDEPYDAFDAFTAAAMKRVFGSTTAVKKTMKKFTVEQKAKTKKTKDASPQVSAANDTVLISKAVAEAA